MRAAETARRSNHAKAIVACGLFVVADVAVVGVPSERWGETPLALVVAAGAGDTPDTGSLVEWTNQRVGRQQRLAGAVFVTELPRNPNGKILKRELRRQYADWEKSR